RRGLVVQLGENFNREIAHLNDTNEAAEVKAIVADMEEGASATVVVTHQSSELTDGKALFADCERAMLKYLDSLRHKSSGSPPRLVGSRRQRHKPPFRLIRLLSKSRARTEFWRTAE